MNINERSIYFYHLLIREKKNSIYSNMMRLSVKKKNNRNKENKKSERRFLSLKRKIQNLDKKQDESKRKRERRKNYEYSL